MGKGGEGVRDKKTLVGETGKKGGRVNRGDGFKRERAAQNGWRRATDSAANNRCAHSVR